MQLVDLVERHPVDVELDLVDGEEVPGDIEHRAPVGEPRGVGDGSAGDLPGAALPGVLLHGGRQELTQRLDGVEESRGPAGGQGDPAARGLQPVALLAERPLRGAQPQPDAAGEVVAGDGQGVAGGRPQQPGEVVPDPARVPGAVDTDAGEGVSVYGDPAGRTDAGAGTIWPSGRASGAWPAGAGAGRAPMQPRPAAPTRSSAPNRRGNVPGSLTGWIPSPGVATVVPYLNCTEV